MTYQGCCYQKQVSKAWQCNYILQISCDIIYYPCLWHLLLAQRPSYLQRTAKLVYIKYRMAYPAPSDPPHRFFYHDKRYDHFRNCCQKEMYQGYRHVFICIFQKEMFYFSSNSKWHIKKISAYFEIITVHSREGIFVHEIDEPDTPLERIIFRLIRRLQ